ncbi:hypothetical protein FVF58_45890 [Paraburkholderia panacisoli]|uniref:Uncharacterized protein n=1 Tax=Paraburkholderia panacisoli TaxID=2603818 RepID=A0A5B0G3V8_9BURK|nr:hypothetical protein [Paraburkholderia panacisoli]KAA0998124.1 hypothetical protein FVF58_45890 [Paraburkholderia panacisoli]
MRREFIAPIIASCVSLLAGCSSVQQEANGPQVWATLVDASRGSTAGDPTLGRLVNQPIQVGKNWQLVPDMFVVRACDDGPLNCKMGVAKPTVRVTVHQVAASQASVSLTVSYDVGPSQTLTNGLSTHPLSTVTMSIPKGATPFSSHVDVARTVELPYGQLRKVDLPNGISVGLCLSTTPASVMPPSGACPDGTLDRFAAAMAAAQSF